MTVYRGVRLVIQNSTSGALTVESAEVLQGQWRSADGLTARGGGIDAQSAGTLECFSETLQIGCEAFVRFASSAGTVHLHWEMPWVGRFDLRTEMDGRRWSCEVMRFEESPACPTALVILSPPQPANAAAPTRRRGR